MKYLEEILPGSFFFCYNDKFILTSDFRIRQGIKQYNCISITNGSNRWIEENTTVNLLHMYYQDEEKNLVLVKEYEHNDDFDKAKNIP
jgi:hypothetical protein